MPANTLEEAAVRLAVKYPRQIERIDELLERYRRSKSAATLPRHIENFEREVESACAPPPHRKKFKKRPHKGPPQR